MLRYILDPYTTGFILRVYRNLKKINTANVFSLPYDFLNSTFCLAHFVSFVTTVYNPRNIESTCVLMASVNTKASFAQSPRGVNIWGDHGCTCLFNRRGLHSPPPSTVEGPAVLAMICNITCVYCRINSQHARFRSLTTNAAAAEQGGGVRVSSSVLGSPVWGHLSLCSSVTSRHWTPGLGGHGRSLSSSRKLGPRGYFINLCCGVNKEAP